MRIVIIAFSGILFPAAVMAQYFQFSQYEFSDSQVNPALIGLTRDAKLDLIFRNQKAGGDLQINSNYLSASVPFFNRSTGKPRGGFGVSALSDKIGPMFSNQEASASLAVNLPVGKHEVLSLGFRGLMRMQRVSLDGLFTGAQFIPGYGFSSAINSGEGLVPVQQQYYTFSAGMVWQKSDKKGVLLRRFGFSFFDFNLPQTGFFTGGKEALPSTLVMHGSWLAYRKKDWQVIPEFLLSRSSNWNVMMAGGRLGYVLNKNDRLDVLMKYAIGRSGIAGLQLHRPQFSLGLTYDFPVGIRNAGNLGALEIGLEYRSPMDPKSRKSRSAKRLKKKKAEASAKKNRKKKNGASTKKTGPSKQNPTAVTKQEVKPTDSIPAVTRIPAVQKERVDTTGQSKVRDKPTTGKEQVVVREKITLHFRFDYNSTDLDEETEAYLNTLGASLQKDLSLTVRLIGHTDNVGPAQQNLRLSLRRAEAVRDYLLELGIAPARISTEGRGESEPLNANTSDQQRALNRRVEIMLLEKD